MFFQELCKTKIGWDDPLNGNLLKMWRKLLNGLQGVTALSSPRFYFQEIQDEVVSCSLHGFGDASIKAYAAVIYLHVTTTVGGYVKLVASKSRVAPVKELTIQRLELLAALVLARLTTHVKEALELDVTITNICMTCWTESVYHDRLMVDAKTIWIEEVQKSLSKNTKFEIWRKQFGIFTDS